MSWFDVEQMVAVRVKRSDIEIAFVTAKRQLTDPHVSFDKVSLVLVPLRYKLF